MSSGPGVFVNAAVVTALLHSVSGLCSQQGAAKGVNKTNKQKKGVGVGGEREGENQGLPCAA